MDLNLNYKRPNIESIIIKLELLLDEFEKCNELNKQIIIIEEIYNKLEEIISQNYKIQAYSLIDSNNKFIIKEKSYFNKYASKVKVIQYKLYILIYKLKNVDKLKEYFGNQYFKIINLTIDGLKKRNGKYTLDEIHLCNEYSNIISNAQIKIGDKQYLLPEIKGLLFHNDRTVRKRAYEAKLEFFKSNKNKFDSIFTSLLDIRNKIASDKGYDSYIDVAYTNLNRTDFTQDDVHKFRENIKKYILPLITNFQKIQKKMLGINHIDTCDERYIFKENTIFDDWDENKFISSMKNIMCRISKETKELFSNMLSNKTIDIYPKLGKASGAFCIYIDDQKLPFIITNNNGSFEDIINFTHEFGHGLQKYMSSKYKLIEYKTPTRELGEVSAMGMEFLIWPYIDEILGKDTIKYKYYHMYQAILFLPYAAAIDEFQEYIYNNPDASIEQRDFMWKKIECDYHPWRSSIDDKKSVTWHQQGHIYFSPFYYIDYALAQMSAIELWDISQTDMNKAWCKYIKICSIGGSKSYKECLRYVELGDPFEEVFFEKLVLKINTWFESINNKI